MNEALAIVIVCAVATALAIAYRHHSYRPAAALVTWLAASLLIRTVLQVWYLIPARSEIGELPYPWCIRWPFHVDEALFVSWPAAILATSVRLFTRRVWWPVAVAWAAVSLGFASAYPWLRLDRLEAANAAVWTIALLASVTCMAHSWHRQDLWHAAHWVVFWLWAVSTMVLAVVLLWNSPVANWEIARRVLTVGMGVLLSYQILRLVRP